MFWLQLSPTTFHLPQKLTAVEYLSERLEAVDLKSKCKVWFLPNRKPRFYSLIEYQFIDKKYPNHYVGRAGSYTWPARLPNRNNMDNFFLGNLTSLILFTISTFEFRHIFDVFDRSVTMTV